MYQRTFKKDKKRVDKFEPQIKSICGQVFIKTAPKRIDCEEATDLIVMELGIVSVACRVRYYEYLKKYKDEFTIRSDRPSGVQTELGKILDGWCDYNFYGFADKDDEYIEQWFIGNLNVFRNEYLALKLAGRIMKHANIDGSSRFDAFKIKDISDKFVCSCGCRKPIVPEVSIYHPVNNPICENFEQLKNLW